MYSKPLAERVVYEKGSTVPDKPQPPPSPHLFTTQLTFHVSGFQAEIVIHFSKNMSTGQDSCPVKICKWAPQNGNLIYVNYNDITRVWPSLFSKIHV